MFTVSGQVTCVRAAGAADILFQVEADDRDADVCFIRHPRLRSLVLSILIVTPFMGAVAGYAAWWGWFRLHFSILSIVAIISACAAVVIVLVRVVYALATDYGVRVDEQGVQVIRRRVLGSPFSGASFRWDELGKPYLLSKLWREIAIPTRGPLLTLSPGQAKVVLNHPRWPGPRTVSEEVKMLIEWAQ
jgi:hypothetical protein